MSIEMFTCPRNPGELRVTRRGCGEMWEKANTGKRPDPWVSARYCYQCPIGAANVGAKCGDSARLERICTRCHRPTAKFIYERLCVSCTNRQYEYIKGRNARGRRPVKLSRMSHYQVITSMHETFTEVDVGLVIDAMESVLASIRRTRGESVCVLTHRYSSMHGLQ